MNEAELHEFAGKFVTDMGGAFMMGMALVGDGLGRYKAGFSRFRRPTKTPLNLILEVRK